MLFLVLFRIAVFVAFFLALLQVKKRRFRHFPARRTRISRRNGESTLWLERLVNAVMDMWFATLLSQDERERQQATMASPSSNTEEAAHDAEEDGAATSEDADGDQPPSMAAALTALLQPVLTRVEERVKAGLEDSGVAGWADFRIHSVGARPPRLRSIHIIQQQAAMPKATGSTPGSGPSKGPAPPSAAAAATPGLAGLGGVSSPTVVVDPTVAATTSSTTATTTTTVPASFAMGSTSATLRANPALSHPSADPLAWSLPPSAVERGVAGATTGSAPYSASVRARRAGDSDAATLSGLSGAAPPTAAGAGGGTSGGGGGGGTDTPDKDGSGSATAAAGGPSPALTVLECEAEIEYSGQLDASLKADVSLGRGRLVPIYVRLQDVRLLRVHARVLLQLCYEPATMESPRRPYLECTVWLESDPQFDMTLRTSLTRLNIQDFFVVPTLARFFLLRFVRAKLVRRNKAPGLTFRIPVPPELVDGGEGPWSTESAAATDYFKDLNSTWRPQ